MLCKILLLLVLSLIGSIIVFAIVRYLIKPYIKNQLDLLKGDKKRYLDELPFLAFVSGFLEIFLYSWCFILAKPEFVVLWIGVKTALRWDRDRNLDKDTRDIEYRGLYYSFLIGSAINIILAYVVASIVSVKFLFLPI